MSANLLSKRHLKKIPAEKRHYTWWFLLAVPGWVILSYIAAQLILLAILTIFKLFGMPLGELFNPTILQSAMAVATYILTLMIVIGFPYVVRNRSTKLEVLGLQRLLNWTDLGLAGLGFVVYGFTVGVVITIIMYLFPHFPLNQAQDVGFKTLGSQSEYALAFLTLVVIAPLAEETLFRGYLYGKLRAHVPVYAAMLMVSFLFALAHGQWNVAIDTFILSIVLTGLREITGSIWAGIAVHMIKNAIAFFALFAPPVMFGF